jgi:phosphoribosylaminoimidazolecarboxamide formyltransferase / IMP cyclohydrolase
MMMPFALLSVHDKTGLLGLAGALTRAGWTLIASGGTAAALRQAGIWVIDVSEYTQSPEVLGGRVKTLHPAIHAGILARSTPTDLEQLNAHNWKRIDLVVANLYPFEQTASRPGVSLEEVIENIDIGGVALIRAAAKNHDRVMLLCDPRDYDTFIYTMQSGEVSAEMRKQMALKGFRTTAKYDAAISSYFAGDDVLDLQGHVVQNLRYGENPHQSAQLYSYQPDAGPMGGRVIQGKELSYNNLLDLDAAWRAVLSFQKPSVCIVKHLSPCGLASQDTLALAYKAAIECDPVSAFGGVIACSHIVDVDTALQMKDLFIECVIAPDFDQQALEVLSRKKNCRLVVMPDKEIVPKYELRSIMRGFLKQDVDTGDPENAHYEVVTQRMPTPAEWDGLNFAWKACQHVKSNAIVIVQGQATVGIGGGQPNRVDSVQIAVQRAGSRTKGAIMASDAFFPFADSIHAAAAAGITAVIQPGGSVRDAESIAAANEAGIAMVFTHIRHFRH